MFIDEMTFDRINFISSYAQTIEKYEPVQY